MGLYYIKYLASTTYDLIWMLKRSRYVKLANTMLVII